MENRLIDLMRLHQIQYNYYMMRLNHLIETERINKLCTIINSLKSRNEQTI